MEIAPTYGIPAHAGDPIMYREYRRVFTLTAADIEHLRRRGVIAPHDAPSDSVPQADGISDGISDGVS